MTDQSDWEFDMPELAADGHPVTPDQQDAIAVLLPEVLDVLVASGCTCEPDVGFVGGGERLQVIAGHDPTCPLGRPDPATN